MRVCYGSTRTVLLTQRYAFKFPGCWLRYPRPLSYWGTLLQGLLANLRETQWITVPPYETFLCPICFALPGGFLLVARRAQPLTDEQYEAFQRGEYSLREALDRQTRYVLKYEDYYVPGECKAASLGMLDNRLVVIDYGE